MTLDMDEWYLLSQPLFENYYISIKSGRRNQSVSVVNRVSDTIAFQEKRFFQSVERSFPTNYHPADEKKTDAATRKTRLFDYKKNRDWAENLTIVMQLGLTMAGCIVFCFFVGHYLDKWLGFKGVFTTIFILLGIAGGANVCYRQILEITEPKDKADPDENGRSGS